MSLVSVIMSVFNTEERALRQAIDCVLSQSLEDFELIIVDDGSTNSAFDIISEIAAKDQRVTVIRHELNMKAAYARNRCISVSRSHYVAIMDSDDYCARDRLRTQMAFLDLHPQIDFVGTAAWLFDEHGVWGRRTCPPSPLARDFLFVLPFVHASLMFRKDALEAVGNYRSTRVTRRTEDYDLLMRMYAHGSKGANLSEPLYSVREDREALRRRKYAYRIDEAWIRYQGFRTLGLLPRGIPYVIKPLVVGVIPAWALSRLKDRRYNRRFGK